MRLARGDTHNPLEFVAFGVGSPDGDIAINAALRLIRDEVTLKDFSKELENLLKDCDAGHTKLMVKLPENDSVRDLALQWALTAGGWKKAIDDVKFLAAKPREEQSHQDFAKAGVIFDALLTRSMTLLINGVV